MKQLFSNYILFFLIAPQFEQLGFEIHSGTKLRNLRRSSENRAVLRVLRDFFTHEKELRVLHRSGENHAILRDLRVLFIPAIHAKIPLRCKKCTIRRPYDLNLSSQD